MHAYLRRGLFAALVTSGGILLAAGQASADETTTGAESLLGGNQVTVAVTAPITVGGNAIAVLDDAAVETQAPATRPSSPVDGEAKRSTDGSDSVAGGNQVNAPVTAPITVGGNAVAVADEATVAGGSGAAPAGAADSAAGDSAESTDGSDSVAGGNQVTAPVTAPITVGGNAVAVADDATVSGGSGSAPADPAAGDSTQSTDGSDSVGGGNQVNAPVTAPITVADNAVGVIGEGTVEAPGAPAQGGTPDTSGDTPDEPAEPSDDAVGTVGSAGPAMGDSSGDLGAANGTGVTMSRATVAAASAIPSLARTGFAPQLLTLGFLALLSGLALAMAGRRLSAVAER